MLKKKIISFVSVLALSLGLTATAFAEEEEETTPEYYVCFSDNYYVQNTNKMTYTDTDGDGTEDTYVLKNKTLTSSMDFYVIEKNSKEKYYASDGSNMKVEDSDSFRYNIYFNADAVYDEAKVKDTDYYESNSHITYDYYIPGDYSLTINGVKNTDFKYNHYITAYDAYILPEASLKKDDIITITDNTTLGSENVVTYSKIIEDDGNYRIVFTPTKKMNSNEYRFDENGNYGTGDDYTENIYLSDVEYYYISFTDTFPQKAESVTFTYNEASVTGYRLIKDEKTPLASNYVYADFFNNKKNHKITYKIYHYSYILDSYELVDDDNDEDTAVSEVKLSDISWYKTTLAVADGRATAQFTADSTDFQNYYMVGEFNNYGYNADGTLNLDEKYKLDTVEETSKYYDKDHKQFINYGFVITKDMLDIDEDDYEFVISNGKTSSSTISIQTPGKYDILYSTETNYNGSSYKYIRTEDADDVYTTKTISTKEEFLKYIDEWNLDSESSKYVIYNLTADIDFAGTEITSVSVFNGTFDGNGHTLSNITLKDEDGRSDIGLFKLVTKYAAITDLTVKNLSITAKDSDYVGFIARNYGWIENCSVSGTVYGKRYTGGLVGYNGNYSTDSDTTSDSSVKYGYGMIKCSTNSVAVYGEINVGGLAGFNGGKILSSNNQGAVNTKSYSSSVTVTNIGGLAGYSTGEMVDSYNKGQVGYNGIGENVGGLAGLLNGEVYFCNNTGKVYGKTNVGGLAGFFGSASADSDSSSATIRSAADITSVADTIMGKDSAEQAYEEAEDISNHCIYYSYVESPVHGVRYVGGLIGYNNASALVVKNCIVTSDVYADSGSYAGGIAGYLNGGSLTSLSYTGYIEANGSINRYVGGIAGYSAGTITACTVNATLSGGQYVGGIAGYVTTAGSVLSCYSNTYIITKSTSQHTGNIAGYIDGMDNSSGTYGDRVKYNYFMGSDLNDYSGIDGVNYGKASHFAAYRLLYSDLLKKNMKDLVSTKFGLIDEDENTNYYSKGTTLLHLDSFYSIDSIDDDKFDDDTDSYRDYSYYFYIFVNKYAELENNASRCVVRTVYKEWDPEIDDNEPDNYKVVKIQERTLGSEEAEALPAFTYVDTENKTKREDALYRVSWENVSSEFRNQTIYATYEEILSNYHDSSNDIYVEGEFTKYDVVSITKNDGTYKITVTENGAEKEITDLTVKVYADKPERCYVTVDGTKIDSTVYGDYVEFKLSSTNSEFRVIDGGFSLSLLPDYAIALIIIIPVFIILVVLIVISNLKSSKKKDEETNPDLKQIEAPKEDKAASEGNPEDNDSRKEADLEINITAEAEAASRAMETEDVSKLEEPKAEEKAEEENPEEMLRDMIQESSPEAEKKKEEAEKAEKKTAESANPQLLTAEEKKARQMENLRKARLAKQAHKASSEK